tara:strand:- start:57 stop:839 length:783 start_codon:yes stop_codon:yes gene_type:complete
MYSYRDQLSLLEPIELRENETKRIDCPFCGGSKTFSITRTDGKRLWGCFRASCGVKGIKSVGYSTHAIKAKLGGDKMTSIGQKSRDLPKVLSAPGSHPAVIQYLKDNHCYEAHESGLVHIRYAPAIDRVLFSLPNDKFSAVGRALGPDKPKWLEYGIMDKPSIVGKGSIAVVVEDIASACSVSRLPFCSGCALLGTSLPPVTVHQLAQYEEVVVALDRDASRKSVDLASQLESRVKTRVRYLSEDLKYLNEEQIKAALAV